MENDRLQKMMSASKVSADAIVEITGVDPKTVQRWTNGRIPHPRHRRVIANLLNIREDVIWPIDGNEKATNPSQTNEIIAAYAHRADVPPDEWWQLFSKAKHHIDLLGYAMSFLPEQHPKLVSLLKEKSKASCKIRIALADPTCRHVLERDEEEQLGGTLPALIRSTIYLFRELWNYEGIEICYHTTPLYNSLFRFDDEMLVSPHLYGLHGSKAPLIHLRCLGSYGMFANFAMHFEAVWASATSIEQISTQSQKRPERK